MATSPMTIFCLNENCLDYLFDYLGFADLIALATINPELTYIIKKKVPRQPLIPSAIHRNFGDQSEQILSEYGPLATRLHFNCSAALEVLELVPMYCSNVKEVRLSGITYSREKLFVTLLETLRNITSFRYHGNELEDWHCFFISRLANLEVLAIEHNSKITGRHLNNLTKLKALSLWGCIKVTPRNFIQICEVNKLRSLNISGCICLNYRAMVILLETQSELVHITVDHCYQKNEIEDIALLPNLRFVYIWWSCRSPHRNTRLIESLAEHQAESLQILRIYRPTHFHENERGAILKFRNLLQLSFLSDQRLYDAFLLKLGTHCPKLRELHVTGCRHITEQGVHKLLETCKTPAVLDRRHYRDNMPYTCHLQDQMRRIAPTRLTVFLRNEIIDDPDFLYMQHYLRWKCWLVLDADDANSKVAEERRIIESDFNVVIEVQH